MTTNLVFAACGLATVCVALVSVLLVRAGPVGGTSSRFHRGSQVAVSMGAATVTTLTTFYAAMLAIDNGRHSGWPLVLALSPIFAGLPGLAVFLVTWPLALLGARASRRAMLVGLLPVGVVTAYLTLRWLGSFGWGSP